MIQLPDFDYDTTALSIKADGVDMEVVIHSGFTQEAIQASQYFTMCCNAAKEQDVALENEVDNFGVKIKDQTETYKSFVAQYAQKLVIDWPVDGDCFDTLLANQSLAWSIIRKSDEKAKEFFEKKNKQLNT